MFGATVASYEQAGTPSDHPQLGPGGSGGGGGGAPVEEHTDQSAESPHPSIDLTDTSNFYIQIGGRYVRIIIDNKTIPPGSSAYRVIYEVMGRLAASYEYLSSSARAALDSLDKIVFTELATRSFSEEARQTFFYDLSELIANATIGMGFAASAILHDARHIQIFQQSGDLNQSRGVAAEIEATNLQLDNAGALWLNPFEISRLTAYRDDPAGIQARTSTPPY